MSRGHPGSRSAKGERERSSEHVDVSALVGGNERGMSDAKYAEWLEAMDRVETALKPIVAEA